MTLSWIANVLGISTEKLCELIGQFANLNGVERAEWIAGKIPQSASERIVQAIFTFLFEGYE